jgi:hypothetical protein
MSVAELVGAVHLVEGGEESGDGVAQHWNPAQPSPTSTSAIVAFQRNQLETLPVETPQHPGYQKIAGITQSSRIFFTFYCGRAL